MKICPVCNTQLLDDAVFCTNCGTRYVAPEAPQQEFEGGPERAPLREGSEVFEVARLLHPGELQRRETLVPVDHQQRIAFVVAHQDVEVRLVALYELSLGKQRLCVVLHRHPLEVENGIDHGADLWRVVRARAEVGRDAPPKVLRLADVDDDAPAISHEITAGAVREVPEPLPR